MAVSRTSNGRPRRCGRRPSRCRSPIRIAGAFQANLGAVLRDRYRLSGVPQDGLDAVLASLAATDVPITATMVHAVAALDAARLAVEVATPGDGAAGNEAGGVVERAAEAADRGFAAAIGLLDRLAWCGLGRDDQEDLLTRFAGVASDAAAWAVHRGRPEQALVLLEAGRGVLLAQAMDARAPAEELRRAAPDLAARLAELDDLLAAQPGSGTDDAHEARIGAARDRDEVLARIRRAGSGGLVDPPEPAALRALANEGPVVVVNISDHRCDALLVTAAAVSALPLDVMAEDVRWRASAIAAAEPTSTIAETMDWLDRRVVMPVLDALGLPSASQDPARLWWCPTGLLTFLPLSAAAHGRVISSVLPTMRALAHARRARPRRATDTAMRTLVVAVPEGAGHAPLPAARREADAVRRHLGPVDQLTGPDATVAAVLGRLDGVARLHLACHGEQDLTGATPARIHLPDGTITIRKLARLDLTGAELAVLSACATVQGTAPLADEALTVASAVQLAGFRHVVGTLWAVPDSMAPRFADAFYADLARMGLGGGAHAVHAAVRVLRDRYPDAPHAWAGYVHVGP